MDATKTNTDFYDQFPGEFVVRSSTDGCDKTFEVYCSSTDQHVISYGYWEDWQHASLVAFSVSEALNKFRRARQQRDSIQLSWHIDDVKSLRPDLNDEQCLVVLDAVKHNHDATIGVNWDVIEAVSDLQFPRP